MSRRLVWLVAAISLIAGLGMLFHPESVYQSPESMDAYFGGQKPAGSLSWSGSWSWAEEPFRFRLVFHGLVDAVARLYGAVLSPSLTTYWCAYLTITLASVVFAGCSTVIWLRAAGCSTTQSLFGFGLWMALPPIHMAFVLPTQTKEDFVAYGLVALGLAAIVRQRIGLVVLISVLGALTRETLLLVPLVFLLTAKVEPLVRFVPMAAGVITLAVVRVLMGAQGHQATAYMATNFSNSLALLAALMAIFGAGWLFVLPWLRPSTLLETNRSQLRTLFGRDKNEDEAMVVRVEKTTVVVLVAMVVLHLGFGRIQETRVTALAAPMVILIAARRFTDWSLVTAAKRPLAIALGVLVLGIVGSEVLGLATAVRDGLSPQLGSFGTKYWWLELYLQLAIAVVIVVCASNTLRRRGRSVVDHDRKHGPSSTV